MRKLVAFEMISLDGYYEGVDHDISWHTDDAERARFAAELLDEADNVLFGRVTYELLAGFWPTPEGEKTDPVIAEKLNRADKIVVSTTLDSPKWANTRLLSGNVATEIARLKEQPGKDLVILGSAKLTVSLIEMGLLDELQVVVSPVGLGTGRSLLEGLSHRIDLALVEARPFASDVLLRYSLPT